MARGTTATKSRQEQVGAAQAAELLKEMMEGFSKEDAARKADELSDDELEHPKKEEEKEEDDDDDAASAVKEIMDASITTSTKRGYKLNVVRLVIFLHQKGYLTK
jgi:hypothetical protein